MSKDNCSCQSGWTCPGCRETLDDKICRYEYALDKIANQDYRGNQSPDATIAFNALKECK